MKISLKSSLIAGSFIIASIPSFAQEQNIDLPPEATEFYEPVPPKIEAGESITTPPSDAKILFDGSDLSAFVNEKDGTEPTWNIEGDVLTVNPGTGGIKTKENFGDMQLHLEWRSPSEVKGEGQGRGNSGVIIMEKYEVQILDSYENETYTNGQAASIYKQSPPLVNATKAPGEWNTYDIIFAAPRFNEDDILLSPAKLTVLHNGVLVQNNYELRGPTEYIGIPNYTAHDEKLPIHIQDHGNPVSFRNIWVRELN
ncbi:hypothetical protein APR41_06770 [Salegentibacter salinarum]|uniref:3-keto-alpha-glucoside-1,2-lyase/3-keto-2-hydroxy-glucal hydratase domain-containing protein n=1 Tax=Salegentibacter salinarum TaxID=447422 RepID=A0A2N0TQX6_9FLAO|nr:DUF1080 domain-containing protein [Salegentibacter salinarum]PKD17130.1 hypothetical protein APR41_06770 [Salegentibacter salinarum]SKB55428.1 protein of unknown function [Salegentibacter salinarum]